MGWLSRKYGLTIDNLVSARVVTADGELRRASADGEPRPVLGGPRRRRQLRGGDGVRVRAARGRADGAVRLPVLGPRPGTGGPAARSRGHRRASRRRQRHRRRAQRSTGSVRAGAAPAAARLRDDRRRLRLARGARRRARPGPLRPYRRSWTSRRRCRTSSCRRCSTRPTPGASTPTTRAATSTELSDGVIDALTETLPEEAVAAVARAVLPARRRLQPRRRGRDGLQRRPLASLRRRSSSGSARSPRCSRPSGTGCGRWPTRCGRTRRADGSYVNGIVRVRRPGPRAVRLRRREVRQAGPSSRRRTTRATCSAAAPTSRRRRRDEPARSVVRRRQP